MTVIINNAMYWGDKSKRIKLLPNKLDLYLFREINNEKEDYETFCF